ncbi:MAG: heteromeric transposase endonuclease subunit TnsA [Clostridiales bacterium]|jgi:hypothetical protein|nr:heteromeric transposase endonuclease subunit TnsA [Clostridiales bacterium]
MAKNLAAKDKRRLKEERGAGVGENYKPYIRTQDAGKLGRTTRVKGIKTNRTHNLLSDLETNFMHILEYSDIVVDIREQFPLDLEETNRIAEDLGVKHPVCSTTKEPVVMTTDFLITVRYNNKQMDVARTCKYAKDLIERQIIKFEIEREYWARKGVDWAIVTDFEVNKTFAQNIKFIHSFYSLDNLEGFESIKKQERARLIQSFKQQIVGDSVIIRDISSNFDDSNSLLVGTSLSIYKHLLMTKQISVDLNKKLNFDHPESVILYPHERMERRAV